MDQKWIQILMIVVFSQQIISGAVTNISAKEGQKVDINCNAKDTASMVVWFRVLKSHRMEFIGSFSTSGMKKSSMDNFEKFFAHTRNRLALKSFKKSDSGIYGCGSLYQGNMMEFGELTQINEDKTIPKTEAPPISTTTKSDSKTTCDCQDSAVVTSPSMLCTPIILGPLAGGCGLLLVLLIVTILFCNRIRTRRCPHHHKRKPRMVPPEKQMMANRHI